MNQKLTLDISPEDLKIIKNILTKHLRGYEVWAFGSRITGKARKHSDLDLAIITQEPIDFDCYIMLKEAFRESNLPFKVDVIDWATISESFREIIKAQFIVL